MQSAKLVRLNVERIILSESRSTNASENQLYVHRKPVIANVPTAVISSSIFSKYWKSASIIGLSLSLCYALISKPAFQKNSDKSEILLAALLAPPVESERAEPDDSIPTDSDAETSAVVFSGSEYQNRLESEYGAKNVPAVVQDPQTSSQVISMDLEARKESFFKRKEELMKSVSVSQSNGEDLKSMVKFIAGLIAVNRPNIPDCGMVAAAIVKLSSSKKVDPFFVAALISVESRFGQNEKSNVGATGLMQLLPSTATFVADSSRSIKPSLTDVTTNIKLGIDYWMQLEKRYHGNRFLALSAYNWGPGNVDKVRTSPSRIPGSVQKYAKTILERHANWLTHFKNAKLGASGVG